MMQILDRLRGRPGRLADLEARRAELEARGGDLLRKQNAAGDEWKVLRAERKDAGVVRKLEIDDRMEKLSKRHEQLAQERDRVAHELAGVLMWCEDVSRRLRGAEHTLEVIENDPDQLEQYSPATIRRERERARQTIKELS